MNATDDYCPHYNGICPHPKLSGGCWACEWYDYEGVCRHDYGDPPDVATNRRQRKLRNF